MKTKPLYASICAALLLGATPLASAQTPTPPVGSNVKNPIDNAKVAMSAEYRAEKDRIEADYDVAKEKCEDKAGVEVSACKKAAKADERAAIAKAKANKKVASK